MREAALKGIASQLGNHIKRTHKRAHCAVVSQNWK